MKETKGDTDNYEDMEDDENDLDNEGPGDEEDILGGERGV